MAFFYEEPFPPISLDFILNNGLAISLFRICPRCLLENKVKHYVHLDRYTAHLMRYHGVPILAYGFHVYPKISTCYKELTY
jgi:hypothetical protein